MKTKLAFLLASTLGVTLQFAPSVLAQPPADRPLRELRMERRARWAGLTEEERSKLKAAHQKAMADPIVRAAHDKLRQARREFRDVMQPALLKADPSVGPILEKLRLERAEKD
jgi:hypothetical protein